jgi:chitinase
VDIDWEPWDDSYGPLFTNLVVQLRAALNGINSHLLLTTALTLPDPWNSTTLPQILASVNSQFDQINLQTYDLSGPYPGWISWHNSAIYDDGVTMPGDLQVPSVNGAVLRFITNGVPAAKLGLGVTFHGQLWNGESGPDQTVTELYAITPITYNDIVADYSTSPYTWDAGAVAPYIGITNSDSADSVFISYDDPRACESKVSYARNLGLGGMIIWELKQDYTGNGPDPLLNAVKQALATPGTMTAQNSGSSITLSFQGAPLGSYAVQWTTNLAASTAWNTLTVTNLTNASAVIPVQVSDTVSAGQSRFYRVKTPP